MKKCLIVDGQILQTDAWYRGMGKYTLQVLNQLNQRAGSDLEVVLLFNRNLACDQVRFETLSFLYPAIKQYKQDLPLASDKLSKTKDYKARLNSFVAGEFDGKAVTYLLTSLFLFDFFAEFPDNCQKLMMFYDLTPLRFWKDLGGYFPPDLYMSRLQKLYEADKVLAISETTRQDLLSMFGLPPGLVININGGFTKIAEATKKPLNFNVPKHYVLFPTGNLPHKNNEVAVKGFELYCRQAEPQLRLLITSHFSDESKQKLQTISDKIIFTDNVSDEELEWLYQNADLILFASKYEGLGLPILDAVANHKPVITSKIPVFEEMSKEAFYFFNTNDPEDLAAAIKLALKGTDFSEKSAHYSAVLKKYTWANTAGKLLASVRSTREHVAGKRGSKPRLAVVSLQPTISNQISRLAEVLYYCLRQDFQVDYFFDANGQHFRDAERPTFLDYLDCQTLDISKFDIAAYKKHQGVVYLLDKACLPSRVAQRAAVLPGLAVVGRMDNLDQQQTMLKEIVLGNQFDLEYLEEDNFEGYKALAARIAHAISNPSVTDRPEPAIFQHHSSHHAIIKELKMLHE